MVKQVHEHCSHPQHAWVCGCLPDGRMAGKEKGFDLISDGVVRIFFATENIP